MRFAKVKLSALLIISVILLSGCGETHLNTPQPQNPTAALTETSPQSVRETPETDPSEQTSAVSANGASIVNEDFFNAFTSSDLKGRFMGTTGNQKAQEILISKFSELGLSPFNQEFKSPIFANFSKRPAYTVVLKIPGEKDRILDYYNEYTVAPGKAYSGEYRVVYQTPAGTDEKVLFIEDGSNEEKVRAIKNNQSGYIHIKSPMYKSVVKGAAPDLHLFLSMDIIETLVEYDGTAYLDVDIPQTENIQTLESNNIIGLIPGKNHEQCVVISAHYDGANNDTAALDNGSGIYGLLKTAEKLKMAYSGKQPDFDIIICAFEGEEKGFIGSGFVSDQIKAQYKRSIVINLDCIGLKGPDSYMVIGDQEKNGDLIQYLYGGLDSEGLQSFPGIRSYQSDHIPFEWIGIPAVTIGERDILSIIHSPSDTTEVVDLQEIDSLSDILVQFVTEKAGMTLQSQ